MIFQMQNVANQSLEMSKPMAGEPKPQVAENVDSGQSQMGTQEQAQQSAQAHQHIRRVSGASNTVKSMASFL